MVQRSFDCTGPVDVICCVVVVSLPITIGNSFTHVARDAVLRTVPKAIYEKLCDMFRYLGTEIRLTIVRI